MTALEGVVTLHLVHIYEVAEISSFSQILVASIFREMGSTAPTLHILFFPLMAPGHMIPTVDMAKLFAARGVKATILTTPANAPVVRPSVDSANESGYEYPIQLSLIPFPPTDGLPEGCENLSSATEDTHDRFFSILGRFREPFDNALSNLRPDCVVTDMFFPWTADAAEEHGIPRLFFDGSNFFSQCVFHSIQQHMILESPSTEESVVVPGLPHHIELRRSTVLDNSKMKPVLVEIFQRIRESESKNYGMVVNTFYELEPEYADYYRNVIGRKAWSIGPLSLCNKNVLDKSVRGKNASVDHEACLKWLDSKAPRSAVYICFGSMTDITAVQLRQIALGLEASSHPFVWVVRKDSEEWMPEGFEERTKEKGLVIRGWAPQILILNHGSVGGYLTHCGWNSSLEGISAGLPFITWPLFAEQFHNERLIVDVLKIGVAIGSDEYAAKPEARKIFEAAKIEAAIEELMGNDMEAEERRRRARELRELARRAVENGGSSYNDVDSLIAELMERRAII